MKTKPFVLSNSADEVRLQALDWWLQWRHDHSAEAKATAMMLHEIANDLEGKKPSASKTGSFKQNVVSFKWNVVVRWSGCNSRDGFEYRTIRTSGKDEQTARKNAKRSLKWSFYDVQHYGIEIDSVNRVR